MGDRRVLTFAVTVQVEADGPDVVDVAAMALRHRLVGHTSGMCDRLPVVPDVLGQTPADPGLWLTGLEVTSRG